MTKKAMNLKNKHSERINNQISFYERVKSDFDFAQSYLHTIHEDFTNMIGGMFIYGLLSKKDYNELHTWAYEMYVESDKKVWEIRRVAEYE